MARFQRKIEQDAGAAAPATFQHLNDSALGHEASKWVSFIAPRILPQAEERSSVLRWHNRVLDSQNSHRQT